MELLGVFFSSRRRHTRYWRDWSSDVCSSDLRRHHRRERIAFRAAARSAEGAGAAALLRAQQVLLVPRPAPRLPGRPLGRASRRGRVEISVVAGSLKTKEHLWWN